jgi:hypothetical protein
MPVFVILALLGFWLYLAFQSFQRGNTGMAVVFALVGLTIALYRFRKSTRGD